jgi:cell division protein FtsW
MTTRSYSADPTASVNAVRPGRTRMRNFDLPLVLAAIALLMLGLLMVYSASIALGDGPRYAAYGRYYFILRHGLFIGAGVMAAVVTLTVPVQTWEKVAVPLFMVSLLLLALVLIPGIGREVNGARRWIPLGPINFQPSELMKIATVIYAANYTVRKQEHMQAFARGFLPMACALGAVGMLLLLEPDLGAFMVIAAIAVGVLFMGGINGKYFSGLMTSMVGMFLLLIWLSPWRRARLFAYLDPWNEANAYGSAYQLSHSLIAFGRGAWLGVGLGDSVEKLHYLPEAHTDFLMAVVGEELGFAGVMAVIALFAVIVQRGFDIGRQAIAMERTFAGLTAHGVALWFGVQAFINMGVCLGLLPTKGLTLPLMSYGGSGIVMNLCALALLLRVDIENRILMRGGRL